jgi:ABC-type phosphate/phosphonate transport system ATPase subunit
MIPGSASARDGAYSDRRMRHFLLLDHEQQRQAIQRLAAAGMHETTIAAATTLSVEQIQRILAERPA